MFRQLINEVKCVKCNRVIPPGECWSETDVAKYTKHGFCNKCPAPDDPYKEAMELLEQYKNGDNREEVIESLGYNSAYVEELVKHIIDLERRK